MRVSNTKISHNESWNIQRINDGLITDFTTVRLLYHKWSKNELETIPIAIATSMADILIATQPKIRFLLNPWKFESRVKWGTFLRHLDNNFWIMPRLTEVPLNIHNRPVLAVEIDSFIKSCEEFFRIYCENTNLGDKY